MRVNYERFGFQPLCANTADIVQVLLVAWDELMLHQPSEHCGHARFEIVQELVPITGQKCEQLMRDLDFSLFGLIQLTLSKCCWLLGMS